MALPLANESGDEEMQPETGFSPEVLEGNPDAQPTEYDQNPYSLVDQSGDGTIPDSSQPESLEAENIDGLGNSDRAQSSSPRPSSFSNRAGKFVKKNRTKLIVGGIVSTIIAAVVGGFVFLAQFALIHIDEVMHRAWGSIEQRVDQHREKAIIKDIAKGAKTGAKATGATPLADLVDTVNTSNIKTDLEAEGDKVTLDPADGHITSIDTGNGQSVDPANLNGAAGDVVVSDLDAVYPVENYKDGPRLGSLFGRLNIQRFFFTDENPDNPDKWYVKTLRQRLFGNGQPVKATDQTPTKQNDPNAAANAEIANTADGVAQAAQTLRTEASSDDAPDITNIIVDDVHFTGTAADVSSIAKAETAGAAEGAAKGALNPAVALTYGCQALSFVDGAEKAAEVDRELPLIREGGLIEVAAAQERAGQHVNAAQHNALMKSLSAGGKSFGQSGGWQIATGANPHATNTSSDLYSRKPGNLGVLADINSKVGFLRNSLACTVSNSIVFQGALTVIGTGAAFFSGGGSAVAGAAAGAASGAILAAAQYILEPILVRDLAGVVITGNEDGLQLGNAITAGYDNSLNTRARNNGGRKLSSGEVQTLRVAIAGEQKTALQHQSLAYRLFNINNPDSLLAKLSVIVPIQPSQFLAGMIHLLASINPFDPRIINSIAHTFIKTSSSAALADAAVDDPWGVDQYGLTDDEATRYDPVDNEKVVLQYKSEYLQFVQNCLESMNPDTYNNSDCTDQNDLHTRFRIYRQDLSVAGGLNFMSRSSAQMPDPDAQVAALP